MSKLPVGVAAVDHGHDKAECDGCGKREWCLEIYLGMGKAFSVCPECARKLDSILKAFEGGDI